MNTKRINGRVLGFTSYSDKTQELIKELIVKIAPEFHAEMKAREYSEMLFDRYNDFFYIHASLASNIKEEDFLKEQKQLIWEAMSYMSECDYDRYEKIRFDCEH